MRYWLLPILVLIMVLASGCADRAPSHYLAPAQSFDTGYGEFIRSYNFGDTICYIYGNRSNHDTALSCIRNK